MATQTTTVPEVGAQPAVQRRDNYWFAPISFVLLFTAFAVWATLRAFQNAAYDTALMPLHSGDMISHYLSPFYSPTVQLGIHILGFNISPALLILPFPLSFRLSCYYYRKAIYRGYLADPFACAVTEPKPLATARFRKYMGERAFPFIAMNFHRYAFYAAVVFIVLLWGDTFQAFTFSNESGRHFGIHLGSLVFLANILLLSCYTFSCHSWRHLIGGNVDCYSCSALTKTKYGLWTKVSFLNERHGLWAMMSLVSVALTDVFVYFTYTTNGIYDFKIL